MNCKRKILLEHHSEKLGTQQKDYPQTEEWFGSPDPSIKNQMSIFRTWQTASQGNTYLHKRQPC